MNIHGNILMQTAKNQSQFDPNQDQFTGISRACPVGLLIDPAKRFFVLLVLCMMSTPVVASAAREARRWEPVTWTFRNPFCSVNPFDLVVKADFTHTSSGRQIRTELFYDGGDRWKLRFTGTHTGLWSFVTEGADPELNDLKGQIDVHPNPEVPGFMTKYGSKWGRTGIERAFVPQYVMYCDPPAFCQNPGRIDADIREFFVEHGFNGFHIIVVCRWFDLDKQRSNEISSGSPNSDPRTFEAIELLIAKVRAAGGGVHIWAWGDEQRKMTPKKWGLNGEVDRRLQRYICARLGPLPGWSMSYGFDLQEWVDADDLRRWHQYMHDHLGWFHFLGGRAPEMTRIYDGLEIFYKEDTDSIRMDLSELSGVIRAVAVDTRSSYREIGLEGLRVAPDQLFRAPGRSDWAVAVQAVPPSD